MLKILFIVNIPSPYRIAFFNELGKQCDLTVLFEMRKADDRDESWTNYKFHTFKGVFLKGIKVGAATSICVNWASYLKKSFDYIICGNFTSPTGILAILYMQIHNIPYWLESDGGFAKNGKGLKEYLKKKLVHAADGYFSTGIRNDEYYLTYGADAYRIHRYPFTSVYAKDIIQQPLSDTNKSEWKRKLGITEKILILSVGQFIYRKGFDVLIQATRKLNPNIGVYIVGGNPTKEYKELALGLENLHFEGFKFGNELKEYYYAADVFVLPTREDIWGLVINEAIANALPIITTDRCNAGVEIIKEGINGCIIPSDNSDTLADKIECLAEDKIIRSNMAYQNLKRAHYYTIENMANTHITVLNSKKGQ